MSQIARRFEGKSILITGAASGIGKATARAFATEGGKLVLVDRNESLLAETVAQLVSSGAVVSSLALDVTSKDAPEKMVEFAMSNYGGLDIAHNNSGITGPNVDIADYPDEGWQGVLDINLTAVFRSMKTQIRVMRENKTKGAIINTGSVASYIGLKLSAGYIASKHALLGLTRAAALDAIGDGIRINAVCPGIIDTPLLDSGRDVPGFLEFISSVQPIGRMGTAEEVAKSVLFLASEESSMMVGHGMLIDGGVTIQ